MKKLKKKNREEINNIVNDNEIREIKIESKNSLN